MTDLILSDNAAACLASSVGEALEACSFSPDLAPKAIQQFLDAASQNLPENLQHQGEKVAFDMSLEELSRTAHLSAEQALAAIEKPAQYFVQDLNAPIPTHEGFAPEPAFLAEARDVIKSVGITLDSFQNLSQSDIAQDNHLPKGPGTDISRV